MSTVSAVTWQLFLVEDTRWHVCQLAQPPQPPVLQILHWHALLPLLLDRHTDERQLALVVHRAPTARFLMVRVGRGVVGRAVGFLRGLRVGAAVGVAVGLLVLLTHWFMSVALVARWHTCRPGQPSAGSTRRPPHSQTPAALPFAMKQELEMHQRFSSHRSPVATVRTGSGVRVGLEVGDSVGRGLQILNLPSLDRQLSVLGQPSAYPPFCKYLHWHFLVGL